MGFIRNPEIRKNIIIWSIISVAAVIITFLINIECGITAAVLCVIYSLLHWITTYRRYESISELSHEIDKILYDCNKFDLSSFAEGELGILQSEVSKMTIKLREQADTLIKDKKYLSDSIADISHQIRTPLTSINLLVDFLSEPDITDERRMELIKQLFTLLDRIDWLINTLLKISKFDAGTAHLEEKNFDAKNLIRRAIDPVSVPIELRGQTLNVSVMENSIIHGDIAWTTEAVENIIKNCMEHTPEGGTINVDVKDTSVYVQITVSDTGNGISKEDLPHIFERFYRGHDSADTSVGIGLALSRMIINKQNGTIKASNNSDGGARFEIKFYKSTV